MRRSVPSLRPHPTDNNCARPLLRRADPMERRSFIVMTLALAEWPLAGSAQQKAMPVIGFLSGGSSGAFASAVAAFRQGLSDTGYVPWSGFSAYAESKLCDVLLAF